MTILFDVIYLLLAFFYLPSLLFKGKRRIGLRQRFGIYSQEVKKALKQNDNFAWVHAVSVGEMKAAAPLIEQLRALFPNLRFVISTITPTGNTVAKQIAENEDIIIYLPFDLSVIVKKTLSLINPRILIILETELWPNMIRIAAERKIPVIIANGRISDEAYPRYKKFSFVFAPIIKRIGLLCMQSGKDAQRIIDLGARPQNVQIVGNIKFDQVSVAPDKQLPELKMGKNELLIVAGSTHDNEEEMLSRVFMHLKQKHNNIRLLIAPRHPHRALEVERILGKYGLSSKRLSEIMREGLRIRHEDVMVLDIMGVLAQVYKSADIVFIGGSLVKHGGQNPIEPALCLKPIIFGKYMFNFHEIEKMFLSCKAAVSVDNEEDLTRCLDELIRDKGKRKSLAANAKALVLKNQGAVKRIISLLIENKLIGG
ncbi:MAG: 3-deoxy-D-manno-octulosonic acid transferase [Candidatus Omnitrophica bacterium]|nr:3-deoxy-D-manno-octulosonic acid transferase [Candidatus Omnitrophota bacterium]